MIGCGADNWTTRIRDWTESFLIMAYWVEESQKYGVVTSGTESELGSV